MKVIKWVRGYDETEGGKPIWHYRQFRERCVNLPTAKRNRLQKEAEQAVIDCIRRNGFKFGGLYHQRGKFGMPVFEDGTIYFATMRQWGEIMAEAWNMVDKRGYGYELFAWENEMENDGGKVPRSESGFAQEGTTK